ncbi:unnamed protein product [Chrysoparadoxa australica]
MTFRVATYNVLSSRLASPLQHPMCDPSVLQSATRMAKVQETLQEEVDRKGVICLQEVSQSWQGPLNTWFLKRGYELITGMYGSPFSGYMGVAMAWPMDEFDAIDIEVRRLSDTKRWGRKPEPGLLAKLANGAVDLVRSWVMEPKSRGFGKKQTQPVDAYAEAKGRYNQMLFARLQHRSTGKVFCVGTYHMPCAFWCPPIMVIHNALLVQHMLRLAKGDPAVLAGDFNFEPGSACYRLVTTGELSLQDPDYPTPPSWEESVGWGPSLPQPMISAYSAVEGEEPAWTNWSHIGDNGEFRGTLDYLFHDKQLQPTEVRHLPERSGPLPSVLEPSDHVLIAASYNFLEGREKPRQTIKNHGP